jgi:3-methylcrotonyl-CoA carboxylase alpha subunit
MDSHSLRGRTILVVGEYRQTVTVVRSLHRAGMRVTFASADPASPTRYSRAVSRWVRLEEATAERYCDQLEALLRSDPHDAVFVVGESPLRRFLTRARTLEPLATWVQPSSEAIRQCFDKSALYALLPGIGVPCLPWARFAGPEEGREAAARIGYPLVVKHVDSSATLQERKAIVCREPGELEAFLAALPRKRHGEEVVMQKFHRGVRHNCHVAACGGRLLAYFQQEVLRTDQLDDTGIGTSGVSVPPDARLRSYCESIVRAVGYEGIGCIQFLVDEGAGDPGFLEFNARMDSTAALPFRLGYDYPLLAVSIALHRRGSLAAPQPVTAPYPAGETYHWLLGDLWAWITAARARALPPEALARWAARSARLALTSHHLTFDWRDPLPTLVMYRDQFLRRIFERLLTSRRARAAAGD